LLQQRTSFYAELGKIINFIYTIEYFEYLINIPSAGFTYYLGMLWMEVNFYGKTQEKSF
jgi:hypothetical protein